MCEGIIKPIEHFIVECEDYKRYRDELIFKIKSIIGREEWQIRVMNGQELCTILCLMKGNDDNWGAMVIVKRLLN